MSYVIIDTHNGNRHVDVYPTHRKAVNAILKLEADWTNKHSNDQPYLCQAHDQDVVVLKTEVVLGGTVRRSRVKREGREYRVFGTVDGDGVSSLELKTLGNLTVHPDRPGAVYSFRQVVHAERLIPSIKSALVARIAVEQRDAAKCIAAAAELSGKPLQLVIENDAPLYVHGNDDFTRRALAGHIERLQQLYFRDLDHAEAKLKQAFPGFYIYRGGNHVAVHRASGDPIRIAVVVAPR